MVLVDTCIWSAALRRQKHSQHLTEEGLVLRRLIRQHRAVMIGPILQEILTGIRHEKQFLNLKEKLSAFDLLPISGADYINAAECSNACRRNGVQGAHTDFLIAAIAIREGIPVLTADKDFVHYQQHIPLKLYSDPSVF